VIAKVWKIGAPVGVLSLLFYVLLSGAIGVSYPSVTPAPNVTHVNDMYCIFAKGNEWLLIGEVESSNYIKVQVTEPNIYINPLSPITHGVQLKICSNECKIVKSFEIILRPGKYNVYVMVSKDMKVCLRFTELR